MQRCWRSAARRWRSGRRRSASAARGSWSWLSPAVGLALLCALCWGTVRLPGDGVVSAVAVPLLAVASVAYLRGRLEGGGEALRAGWPVALLALLAASLPFVVEGHFGILGTSFNPDMSQHLLATDRLADGARLAAAAPGLSARAARDRRRPQQGPRDRPGPGLQRPDRRRRGPRPADRARRLREPEPLAAHRRRPGRRPRLRGRLLLRPGRLQGDDAGALRPRLRPRPARVDPAPGATCRCASSRRRCSRSAPSTPTASPA